MVRLRVPPLRERLDDLKPLSQTILRAITGREMEVLRMVAQGQYNAQIAESLHITEGTVKNHVSNILSKMGVRDRTRAVLKSLELGLI